MKKKNSAENITDYLRINIYASSRVMSFVVVGGPLIKMKSDKRILWAGHFGRFILKWIVRQSNTFHVMRLRHRRGVNIDSHEVFNSIKEMTKPAEGDAFPPLCAVFVIHKLTFILAISEVIRLINGLVKGWSWNFFAYTENVTCCDKRHSLFCRLWYELRKKTRSFDTFFLSRFHSRFRW